MDCTVSVNITKSGYNFLFVSVFKAVRLVGMVQAVKPNAVTVTMKKAVTRSTEHAPTDVLPVG